MKSILAIILLALACSVAYAENNSFISDNWPPKKPKNWNDKELRVVEAQKNINKLKAKLDKENKGTTLLNDWMKDHGHPMEDM